MKLLEKSTVGINYFFYHDDVKGLNSSETFKCAKKSELFDYIISEVNINVVYTIAVLGRHFISENLQDILDFLEMILYYHFDGCDIVEPGEDFPDEMTGVSVFISEAETNEAAYKLILDLIQSGDIEEFEPII